MRMANSMISEKQTGFFDLFVKKELKTKKQKKKFKS